MSSQQSQSSFHLLEESDSEIEEQEQEQEQEQEKEKEKEKEKEEEPSSCIICYEQVTIGGKGSVVTRCNHVYCDKCFGQMMQRSNQCGYCREELCPPSSSTKKRLTYTQKATFVHEIITSDQMTQLVYDDMIRQIIYSPDVSVKKDSKQIMHTCIELLKNVRIDYGMTMAGIRILEDYEQFTLDS